MQHIWQQQPHWLKTASWLIIPAIVVIGVIEHNRREARVQANYVRLESSQPSEARQAAEDLVRGCRQHARLPWFPAYLAERLFGNCRPLASVSLQGINLSNAVLGNADFGFVNLSDANLQDADLRKANLFKANLSNADLRDANLNSTHLFNADFFEANLSGAQFREADFFNADLFGTTLSNADLSHGILRDVNLLAADLSNADLSDADLSNVNLRYTNLRDANFVNANLNSTSLNHANLSNVNLQYADLSDANFSNAILLSTDFRHAHTLMPEQLVGEAPPLLCNVALPEHINIDPNRDCDALAEPLAEQVGITLEEAQKLVNQLRQMPFE